MQIRSISLLSLIILLLITLIIMFLSYFFKKPYISKLVKNESEIHLFIECKSKKCGDIFLTPQKIQILYSCGLNLFKGTSTIQNTNIGYKNGNLEIINNRDNKILVSLKCEKQLYEEVFKYVETNK
ncbi:hypothetical protein [Flavobacterium sp. T12S277]|uniref:hypothetical protein n=1 Tax=Flavobacterium sp. T12S277 TaxID=3402752 RepID=UPI003AD89E32